MERRDDPLGRHRHLLDAHAEGTGDGVGDRCGRWHDRDLADPAHPVEVSRLSISESFRPHWTAWDPVTGRIVAPPGSDEDNRLYLLQLDPKSGALTVDESFRDTDGKTGFSFARRLWPHGWEGTGLPHGAVFSR